MTQTRQAKIFRIEEIKEYQVKLFINEIEQTNMTCFVNDLEAARKMADNMEKNISDTTCVSEDFCKAVMKQQFQKKQQILIKNEYPIYNLKTSEVIGWIELDENEELPREISIRGKSYRREVKR